MEKHTNKLAILGAILGVVGTITASVIAYYSTSVSTDSQIVDNNKIVSLGIIDELLSNNERKTKIANAKLKILFDNDSTKINNFLKTVYPEGSATNHPSLATKKLKVLLISDGTVNIPESLVYYLNKWNNSFSYYKSNTEIRIDGEITENLTLSINDEIRSADISILFTRKKYFNNYFVDGSYNSVRIYSFYAWELLSNLPINNGIVGFITFELSTFFDSKYRHDENIGCRYDFLWNKTGIDKSLRTSYVCKDHMAILKKQVSENPQFQPILDDLLSLQDVLGRASKREKNIVPTK